MYIKCNYTYIHFYVHIICAYMKYINVCCINSFNSCEPYVKSSKFYVTYLPLQMRQ